MGGETKDAWREVLDTCKKRHRPRLKTWSRDGFATHRAGDFEALQSIQGYKDCSIGCGTIDCVDSSELSPAQFVHHYERLNKPVLIRSVLDIERWKAPEAWTLHGLKKDRSLRTYAFKCGEDDDGKSVRVRLKHFLRYMKHQKDDSPLYIFDSTFDDDKKAKKLLDDFRIPAYFADDLFNLVGEKRRPPYRWFLVGPKRSGTSVHIDPLGTSAWNTIISGRKRWVLFPPETPKDTAKGKELYRRGEDDEPINFFCDILPRMRKNYGKDVKIVEFIQKPGETVFVPGGWWHGVLNLEDSVAVTQNFCSYVNFANVWRRTRTGRKRMALKWLARLTEEHPKLASRARSINETDGFHMMTAEELKRRKHKKRERKETKKPEEKEGPQHRGGRMDVGIRDSCKRHRSPQLDNAADRMKRRKGD